MTWGQSGILIATQPLWNKCLFCCRFPWNLNDQITLMLHAMQIKAAAQRRLVLDSWQQIFHFHRFTFLFFFFLKTKNAPETSASGWTTNKHDDILLNIILQGKRGVKTNIDPPLTTYLLWILWEFWCFSNLRETFSFLPLGCQEAQLL